MKPKSKYILSTTHLDSHGERVTLEELRDMAEVINSNNKVRWGIDHNREFPPLGRFENAELYESNGEHYLSAETLSYDSIEDVDWNKDLVFESFINPAPFAEVERDEVEVIEIKVDPNSFESAIKFQDFVNELKAESEIEFQIGKQIRKAHLPDAEVIFTLAKSALFYHLIKPIVKKVGEKIADKVVDMTIDKSKGFYKLIRSAISKALRGSIPRRRPVRIVFEMPGNPHIELVAKSGDDKFIFNALGNKKIAGVYKEIESLSKKYEIDKIQFVLTEKGKWKFNYLLTGNGDSLGRRTAVKKRDRRFSLLSGKEHGMSVGKVSPAQLSPHTLDPS